MGLFGRIKQAGRKFLGSVGIVSTLGLAATPGCNKENRETVSPMVEEVRRETQKVLDPSNTPKAHFAEAMRKEMTAILPETNQIQDDPLDGIDFEEVNDSQNVQVTKAGKRLPPIPKISKNSPPQTKKSKVVELTEEDIEIIEDLEEVKNLPLVSAINTPAIVAPTISQTLTSKQTGDEFSAFIDHLNESDSHLNKSIDQEPLKKEDGKHLRMTAVIPKRKEENETITHSLPNSINTEELEINYKEGFYFNALLSNSERAQDQEDLDAERLAFDAAHQSILDTLDRHIEEIKLKNKEVEEAESLKNDFDALFDLWDKEKEVVENRKEAAKIRNVSMIALKEIVPYVQELEFNELNLRGMQNHLIKLQKEIIRLQKMANDLSGKDHPLLEINSENQYVNQNENLRGALSSLVFDPIPTDLEKEKDLNRKALNLITDYERAIGQSERVREDLKFQISEIEFEHSELTKLVRSLAITQANHFEHIGRWKGNHGESAKA